MKRTSKIILGLSIVLVIILIGGLVVGFIKDREYLNNKISELQNKILNVTDTECIIEKNDSENNLIKNEVLSESEALKLGNEMYKKAEESYNGLLLDVDHNKKFLGKDLGWNNKEEGIYYCKVSKDSINKLTNILTDTALKDCLDKQGIICIDNNYYTDDCASAKGGDITYVKTLGLGVVSIDEEEIIFQSISEYDNDEDGENTYIKSYYFTLVKNNDSWLVSEFTLPY